MKTLIQSFKSIIMNILNYEFDTTTVYDYSSTHTGKMINEEPPK
jgi:hypothetical protein